MDAPRSDARDIGQVDEATLRAALAPELKLLKLLGEGTVARVYLARDTSLGRTVAVKLLRPERIDAQALARFEREARAVAAIEHPNVVAVHRFGQLPDGTPYLVMRHAHGRSMAQRMQGEGPLPVVEVRSILSDVAGALAAAHARGVVHRDVRPGNIFWDAATGHTLIGDFGIAALTEEWPGEGSQRLTRTGEVLGDPRYASPEQLRGEPVEPASDVYSLALVAHELLTGALPEERGGPQGLIRARLSGRSPDLDPEIDRVDPGLADLLRRCLLPDPRVRPDASVVARSARPPEPEDMEFAPPLLEFPRVGHLWRALRRRRLPQWVGGAGGAGWVALEATVALQDHYGLPRVIVSVVLITVIAAIAATAVLAWFHGEQGPQHTRPLERWLLRGVVAGWAVAVGVALLV